MRQAVVMTHLRILNVVLLLHRLDVRCSGFLGDIRPPRQALGAFKKSRLIIGSSNISGRGQTTNAGRDISPETIAFNNELLALGQNFDRQSANEVEKRLTEAIANVQDFTEDVDMDYVGIRPNVVSFTASCNAWARSTLNHAAQRSEKILKKAIALWRAGYQEARPNAYTFNAVITAWSRSRDKNSAENAVRILDEMSEFYEEAGYPEDLQPDARCFNMAINCVARSRRPGCADEARALLSRMEALHDEGPFPNLVPDALTFGAIINAYANDRSDKMASDKAAALLQEMESLHQMGVLSCKPNTFVYNSCLNAFAKAGGPANAEKALLFLEVMENLSNAGVDEDIRPDGISYSTVINALANSGWIEAGEKADQLLSKMKHLDVTGDDNVSCNAISYTAACKAWVNSAKVAAKKFAEEGDNKELQSVVQNAAGRAWDILVECSLLCLAGNDKCRPTNATYELVRDAFKLAQDSEGMARVELVKTKVEAASEKHGGDRRHKFRRRR